MKRGLRIAVLGATGAVGQQIIRILEERKFPVEELRPLATARSAGHVVSFSGKGLVVQPASDEALARVDLAFFAASGEASARYAPVVVQAGGVVIDKSSHYRMNPAVPLVVPEVNGYDLNFHKGIVASPNCSTIQMVMALKPLSRLAPLKRVVVSTYQAVSGTGRDAMAELENQSSQILEELPPSIAVYPHQIAFNALPHIDSFDASGYTGEELKMIHETRKILGQPGLAITATTVRIPVFIGHSESVNVEFAAPVTPEAARAALAAFPGVEVRDDPSRLEYPLAAGPGGAAGRDEVLVGRIRRDQSVPYGLDMWIVADNLRKGAATNAVQIAETLLALGQWSDWSLGRAEVAAAAADDLDGAANAGAGLTGDER